MIIKCMDAIAHLVGGVMPKFNSNIRTNEPWGAKISGTSFEEDKNFYLILMKELRRVYLVVRRI